MPIVHDPKTGKFTSSGGGAAKSAGHLPKISKAKEKKILEGLITGEHTPKTVAAAHGISPVKANLIWARKFGAGYPSLGKGG